MIKTCYEINKNPNIDSTCSFFNLKFINKSLETEFKEIYFKNNLVLGRICHIAAIAFFLVISTRDGILVHPSRFRFWFPVIIIVLSVFLSGLLFSYIFYKYYEKYWQRIYFFYVLVTGFCITSVTVFSSPYYPPHNTLWIIICLFFCYALINLTFMWASIAGNMISAVHIASSAFFADFPFDLLTDSLFYLAGINLLGMIICYSSELLSRKSFILNKLLKNEEIKIRDLNEHLEQKIQDRTFELQKTNDDLKKLIQTNTEIEQQLFQSRKLESVGRLAGGVAHDYNNISGIIIGYSELAQNKVKTNDPVYEYLLKIREAVNRSTKITQQLLAFSRQQPIVPVIVDVNKNVKDMLNILKRLLGENIKLDWNCQENLWPVKIDPSQLDQIITNLCVNARDAINGNGKVEIYTENISFYDEKLKEGNSPGPGDYVMITVSDNGTGISEDDKNKIFDPFYTTKAPGKGTGLGLATVYGIVKQNSGYIELDSRINSGTVFKIYFKREYNSPEVQVKKDIIKNQERSGKKILLVEDDPSILNLTSAILTNLGYAVKTASSPDTALKILDEAGLKFDMLLTDVIMPEMNGRNLAEIIKNKIPGIYILYMSGYTSDFISQHGGVEEKINLINKPFTSKELDDKVKEVFNS